VKLGDTLMQMSWTLTDSGLVGLAQLHGEGKLRRVREVVLVILRFTLVMSTGLAVFLFLFNRTFVSSWVGADKYGGQALNIAQAIGVIALSMAHVVLASTSVLGKRLQVGLVTLLEGVIYVIAAFILGHFWGIVGVATAETLGSVMLSIPMGMRFLKAITGLSIREVWFDGLRLWVCRGAPMLALAAGIGYFVPLWRLWVLPLVLPVLGALFVLGVAPLLSGVPIPGRLKGFWQIVSSRWRRGAEPTSSIL
jgi:O-antigen/teichoic acid export membrane protein